MLPNQPKKRGCRRRREEEEEEVVVVVMRRRRRRRRKGFICDRKRRKIVEIEGVETRRGTQDRSAERR